MPRPRPISAVARRLTCARRSQLPRPRRLRPLLAAAAVLMSLATPVAADPAGQWSAGKVNDRPGASVVTLVGREGVSATRVAVFCDVYGRLAASFARRPGLPAQLPILATLITDAGTAPISGSTNRYGVLEVAGLAASEVARLLSAARTEAELLISDGTAYGTISVVGSSKAIARVLKACGGLGPAG
ncbi:MAG: hypothetical protein ACFBRM_12980 [Pikeienuella sp.]